MSNSVTENDMVAKALEAYFKQWQEVGERMKIIQQEQIQRALQPIIESQKAFQKALEPILAEQERRKSIIRSIELPKIALPDLIRGCQALTIHVYAF